MVIGDGGYSVVLSDILLTGCSLLCSDQRDLAVELAVGLVPVILIIIIC